MGIKVGILEDDTFVLGQITRIVKNSDKLEYVMAASSAEQFLKYFSVDTEMDILLTGIELPGISGIEAMLKIKNISPNIEMIVLSSHLDNDTIFKAFRAGASGYLLKDASLAEIEAKIIAAKEGQPALSPAIAYRMINYFNSSQTTDDEYQLNSKERHVIQLLVEGLSYKLIAIELNISIDGIRYYVKKVYRKLHINSRPELMNMYMRGRLNL